MSGESTLNEVLKTFTLLDQPIYTNRNFGQNKGQELLPCECDPQNEDSECCSAESGCLNRLTYMECHDDYCGCCSTCQNRRFQRGETAEIDVFDAGKKGYGVRAVNLIKKDDFIAEYLGEVIDEQRYNKRKQKYMDDKVKHFYFMMLQKNEFIDATEKGGLSRFCNHSCDPNARIEKWVVGPKLRMGLFANRDIQRNEEICFDYKVDRYGAKAQECYCNSKNCIGVLGGKKQTNEFSLPPSAIEGLDLDDDVIQKWPGIAIDLVSKYKLNSCIKSKLPKGSKKLSAALIPFLDSDPVTFDKQESRTHDLLLSTLPATEIEFGQLPDFLPILLNEREHWWIVYLMLERIAITNNERLHSAIVHMRGYDTMCSLLQTWSGNSYIVSSVLSILLAWPKLSRNKIASSKIEVEVAKIRDGTERIYDRKIRNMVDTLLEAWSGLTMAYRIPRKRREADLEVESSESKRVKTENRIREDKRKEKAASIAKVPPVVMPIATTVATPTQSSTHSSISTSTSDSRSGSGSTQRSQRLPKDMKSPSQPMASPSAPPVATKKKTEDEEIQRIISEASNANAQSKSTSSWHSSPQLNSESSPKISTTPVDPVQRVREYYSKVISKYVFMDEKLLGRERCKRHTRDLVNILLKKEEAKNVNLATIDLNEARRKKIYRFVRQYMGKVVQRFKSHQGLA